jgi:hypothetical protein
MDKKLVTIHLLNLETRTTFCKGGISGDMAITPAQAEDPSNRMTFNCRDCYKEWRGEYPSE